MNTRAQPSFPIKAYLRFHYNILFFITFTVNPPPIHYMLFNFLRDDEKRYYIYYATSTTISFTILFDCGYIFRSGPLIYRNIFIFITLTVNILYHPLYFIQLPSWKWYISAIVTIWAIITTKLVLKLTINLVLSHLRG